MGFSYDVELVEACDEENQQKGNLVLWQESNDAGDEPLALVQAQD